MKTVTALQDETESWRNFDKQLHDLLELAEMDDESIQEELETELEALEKDLEINTALDRERHGKK